MVLDLDGPDRAVTTRPARFSDLAGDLGRRSRTWRSRTSRSSCGRSSTRSTRTAAGDAQGRPSGARRAASRAPRPPALAADQPAGGVRRCGRVLRRRDPLPCAAGRARARTTASSRRPTRSSSRPIEELETTNEELQSTNEELETTNEELQSTNEELETMNEELQSTNEELQTMNDELRERTDEAQRRQRVPRVDPRRAPPGRRRGRPRAPRDRVEPRAAEDLWGLRADEVAGRAPPQPRHRPPGRPTCATRCARCSRTRNRRASSSTATTGEDSPFTSSSRSRSSRPTTRSRTG